MANSPQGLWERTKPSVFWGPTPGNPDFRGQIATRIAKHMEGIFLLEGLYFGKMKPNPTKLGLQPQRIGRSKLAVELVEGLFEVVEFHEPCSLITSSSLDS